MDEPEESHESFDYHCCESGKVDIAMETYSDPAIAVQSEKKERPEYTDKRESLTRATDLRNSVATEEAEE